MSDKKRLIDDHLNFVRSVATRIKAELPEEIELDDLVAYGTKGLIEAAERYSAEHGASFTTFAHYRIRGAIFDGLRGMAWLPRGEYARARFEARASNYLAHLTVGDEGLHLFHGPDAHSLEDDMRDLADALGGVALVYITALTAQHSDTLGDNAPHPQERLEQRETTQMLRSALTTLPERERRLVELYYFEDKTLEEAGAVLGLSKSWASRLHARAVELLRRALEEAVHSQTPPLVRG